MLDRLVKGGYISPEKLQRPRNKSPKRRFAMFMRGAFTHYVTGAGSLIGSFFPVSTESLGLPSIHQSSKRIKGSWIDDGIEIRKIWVSSVGLELSDTKPDYSIHSTAQLPIRFP